MANQTYTTIPEMVLHIAKIIDPGCFEPIAPPYVITNKEGGKMTTFGYQLRERAAACEKARSIIRAMREPRGDMLMVCKFNDAAHRLWIAMIEAAVEEDNLPDAQI